MTIEPSRPPRHGVEVEPLLPVPVPVLDLEAEPPEDAGAGALVGVLDGVLAGALAAGMPGIWDRPCWNKEAGLGGDEGTFPFWMSVRMLGIWFKSGSKNPESGFPHVARVWSSLGDSPAE